MDNVSNSVEVPFIKYPNCAEGDLKGLRDSVRQVENEINNLRQDRRTKVELLKFGKKADRKELIVLNL